MANAGRLFSRNVHHTFPGNLAARHLLTPSPPASLFLKHSTVDSLPAASASDGFAIGTDALAAIRASSVSATCPAAAPIVQYRSQPGVNPVAALRRLSGCATAAGMRCSIGPVSRAAGLIPDAAAIHAAPAPVGARSAEYRLHYSAASSAGWQNALPAARLLANCSCRLLTWTRNSSSCAATHSEHASFEPQQQQQQQTGGRACTSLEERYAAAALSAAIKESVLQQVFDELKCLKEALAESQDFRRFVETPALSVQQKKPVLQHLSRTYKLHIISTNLLLALLENGRLSLLRKVADAFEQMYRKQRGEVKCVVTSAQPLNAQQQKEVVAALQKRAGPSAKLLIEYTVNPQLMGGLLVQMGEQILDYSVATRIDRLQAQLLAPL